MLSVKWDRSCLGICGGGGGGNCAGLSARDLPLGRGDILLKAASLVIIYN